MAGARLSLVAPARSILLRRADLARSHPDPSDGWLTATAEGDLVVPLGRSASAAVLDLTAETLDMVGIGGGDRVVIALNSDGAAVGSRWAEAAASIARAAVTIGPRQVGRIVEVVESMGASALVTTPTVAEEVARRVGRAAATTSLRAVVLTGELVAPARRSAIGRRFGVPVGEVVVDPVFGAAIASRGAGQVGFDVVRPGLVGLHPIAGTDAVEWTMRCDWSPLLEGRDLRTGLAGPAPGTDLGGAGLLPAPRWTIGDHVLVRGRWVSVTYLERRLGDRGWCLRVRRGSCADRSTLWVSGDALERVRRFVAEHLPVMHRVGVDDALSGRRARVVDPQHLGGAA